MKISISGGIEIGKSLIEYINNKLSEKGFGSVSSAQITFKKDVPLISCNVNLQSNLKGTAINGNADNNDAYKAFDEALKISLSQLRKEKDKIVTKKKQAKK